MKEQRHEFELFADYHQFYLQDEDAKGDLSDAWTLEAVDRLLAIAPGTIGIGTVRDMDVPVIVEIRDEEPADDETEWDQVNERSLEVPTGRIVIAGCTDYFPDAARIEVSPGTYRARVFYGGLSSLSDDALEGDDHYRVVLWKGSPTSVVIRKGRSEGAG